MSELTYYTDGLRHLVCEPYSIQNLHEMAKRLGINRAWYHPGNKPHYDIPKRRIEEIEGKCIKVSPKQIIMLIRGNTPCLS